MYNVYIISIEVLIIYFSGVVKKLSIKLCKSNKEKVIWCDTKCNVHFVLSTSASRSKQIIPLCSLSSEQCSTGERLNWFLCNIFSRAYFDRTSKHFSLSPPDNYRFYKATALWSKPTMLINVFYPQMENKFINPLVTPCYLPSPTSNVTTADPVNITPKSWCLGPCKKSLDQGVSQIGVSLLRINC